MNQTHAEQVRLMAETLVDKAKPDAVEMWEDEAAYDAYLCGVEWGARAAIRYLAQAIFDQATSDVG